MLFNTLSAAAIVGTFVGIAASFSFFLGIVFLAVAMTVWTVRIYWS